MKTLRAVKKLLLGETWLLPGGLAAAFVAALGFREFSGSSWMHVGGFVLLAGVLVVLLASVGRAARGR